MTRFYFSLVTALLLCMSLTACQQSAVDSGDIADDQDMNGPYCQEGDYESLVGASLAAVTLPADLEQRVIQHDEGWTEDYRPGRLNLLLDESGTIARVWCG